MCPTPPRHQSFTGLGAGAAIPRHHRQTGVYGGSWDGWTKSEPSVSVELIAGTKEKGSPAAVELIAAAGRRGKSRTQVQGRLEPGRAERRALPCRDASRGRFGARALPKAYNAPERIRLVLLSTYSKTKRSGAGGLSLPENRAPGASSHHGRKAPPAQAVTTQGCERPRCMNDRGAKLCGTQAARQSRAASGKCGVGAITAPQHGSTGAITAPHHDVAQPDPAWASKLVLLNTCGGRSCAHTVTKGLWHSNRSDPGRDFAAVVQHHQ